MGLDVIDFPKTGERIRIDPDAGTLVGSRCPQCHATAWPARAVCHRCSYAPTKIEAFARRGQVLSYTTVWVPRPGVPAPFVLGQVKLDNGPLIVAHIRELAGAPSVPFAAELVVSQRPGDVPPFWFVPHAELVRRAGS